jgi:hypothetical protein
VRITEAGIMDIKSMTRIEILRRLADLQERYDARDLTDDEEVEYEKLEDAMVQSWMVNFEDLGNCIRSIITIWDRRSE